MTTSDNLRVSPRLQMKLDWILRFESLPMPAKRLILLLTELFIIPSIPTGIERLPIEYNLVQLLKERPIINGSLEITLLRDELLRIGVQSPLLPTMPLELPLPIKIESLPIGRKSLPLFGQLTERFTKPVCRHSLNTFVTFDGLMYKHEVPTPKCEQVLVQTIKGMKPSVKVTVRKELESLRSVKIVIDKVDVEVFPRKNTKEIPSIWVRFCIRFDFIITCHYVIIILIVIIMMMMMM